EKGAVRVLLQERACHWYALALPKLSGDAKTKVEKRLAEAAPTGKVGQNLIINGSFEEGPDPQGNAFVTLQKGSTDIKGWEVTRGDIDHISTYWPAAEGNRSLDMNGIGPGGIAQTFKTVKGRKYRVTFSMAANPDAAGEKKLVVSAAGKTA